MTENLSTEQIKARMAAFDDNYRDVCERIARACERAGRSTDEIHLLAATKTVPVEVINYAIERGIKLIGENRVQEFCDKFDRLDKSAERHHIGRLQTNKVKYIVGKVSMVESVDSVKLAEELSKRSLATGVVTDALVEVNIGDEQSKSGVRHEEAEEFVLKIAQFEGIRVRGLMCIPPICESDKKIREIFNKMYKLFIDISTKKTDNINMEFLSMGMSGDFEQAIESGSNIIRLGSCLFGARSYN